METTATFTARDHDPSAEADVRCRAALPATASPNAHGWVLRRAQPSDTAAVTALFWKLHAFNAGLDRRFALAEGWEATLGPLLDQAVAGREALCLIARATDTDQPCGFALAAVHRDSGLWRYREWVEVEALYVEEAWRGRGLAQRLLARACAWADTKGQPIVQLYVTASNERALRFYQHEGFRQTQVILRWEPAPPPVCGRALTDGDGERASAKPLSCHTSTKRNVTGHACDR